MEHLEKLIPLAVLLGVAAFLVGLLRRLARENTVVDPRRELVVKPTPVLVDRPKEGIRVAARPVEPAAAPVPLAIEPKPAAPPPKRRKRAEPKPVVPATPTKSPIQSVLGLLQEKDTLVTAFLLREILGPPVSKQK